MFHTIRKFDVCHWRFTIQDEARRSAFEHPPGPLPEPGTVVELIIGLAPRKLYPRKPVPAASVGKNRTARRSWRELLMISQYGATNDRIAGARVSCEEVKPAAQSRIRKELAAHV